MTHCRLEQALRKDNRFMNAVAHHMQMPAQLNVADACEELRSMDAKPDGELLFALRTLSNVESDSMMQLSHALHLGVGANVALEGFLTKWAFEEAEHGRALGSMASALESRPGSLDLHLRETHRAQFSRWHRSGRHLAYAASSMGAWRYPIYATFGAIQEASVMRAYVLLRDRMPGEKSRALVSSIVAQEAMHLAIYRTIAFLALEEHQGAQWATKRLLIAAWKPVGHEAMGRLAFQRIVRFLCDSDEDYDYLGGSDDSIRSLPGLTSVSLMRSYLLTHMRPDLNGVL